MQGIKVINLNEFLHSYLLYTQINIFKNFKEC